MQSCGQELSINLADGLKSFDIKVDSSPAAWAYTKIPSHFDPIVERFEIH